MKKSNSNVIKIFMPLISILFCFLIIDSRAQTSVSGKITAENVKTQRYIINDIEGHRISLTKGEGVNKSINQFMNGAKIVNHVISDIVNGSGVYNGYLEMAKDGNVIHMKWEGQVHVFPNSSNIYKSEFNGTFTFIKGTGKYKGIRGFGTFTGEFKSADEYFANWDGEYYLKEQRTSVSASQY